MSVANDETIGDRGRGKERTLASDGRHHPVRPKLNQRYKRGNLRENFVTCCDQVSGEDELLHNT